MFQKVQQKNNTSNCVVKLLQKQPEKKFLKNKLLKKMKNKIHLIWRKKDTVLHRAKFNLFVFFF